MQPWLNETTAENGLTVSENFRRWFDESLIVRPSGEPLVLFHGTRAEESFDRFRPSAGGAQGPGIYLSNLGEGETSEYGHFTMPVLVRMKNPFFFYPSDDSLDAMVNGELLDQVLSADVVQIVVDRIEREGIDAYGDELRSALEARGHDGIVMVYEGNSPLAGGNVVIAWEPDQIKSALGNSGLFEDGPSLCDRPDDIRPRRGSRPT